MSTTISEEPEEVEVEVVVEDKVVKEDKEDKVVKVEVEDKEEHVVDQVQQVVQ